MPIARPDGSGLRELVRAPARFGVFDRDADLALVRDIRAGSAAAWNLFLERYLGLMSAVIRRYLPGQGREGHRAVVADLLGELYGEKLDTYQGRSSLSTWLTLVARTVAVDQLRRRFGRRAVPRGLKRLGNAEKKVFQLYYMDGLSIGEVLRQLGRSDPTWSVNRLLAVLDRIEREVDDRSLSRIAYDLHAQSTGAASGRLLAYLDHVRAEFQLEEGAHRPEYHIMEREARHMVERLRAELADLPEQERRIYTLRFERGWSAQQIAEELGLADTRSAYTLIERLKRLLKRRLQRPTEQGH